MIKGRGPKEREGPTMDKKEGMIMTRRIASDSENNHPEGIIFTGASAFPLMATPISSLDHMEAYLCFFPCLHKFLPVICTR